MFESRAQAWVNTVNCVGVMGKGIALEFRKRFPDMFLARIQQDPFTNTTAPLRVKPGWFALVEILARIVREPYHPPLGRVSLQKLAYFASVLGLPLELQFVRGSYGPYARSLTRVIASLSNNGLIEERPLGRLIAITPGPTFTEASRKVYQGALREWEPVIQRLVDLFMRMDTRAAEVAATVHYAASELKAKLDRPPTEVEVLKEVMAWKARRKPPFRESEVASAIRNLAALRLIDVRPSPTLPLDPLEALEVGDGPEVCGN